MNFLTEIDFQTPCGGSIHFAAKKISGRPVGQRQRDSNANSTDSYKLSQANGEETQFTYESTARKGAKFWGTKIESR